MEKPVYTITQDILKNIAGIEYSRAVIENAVILPNIQRAFDKEIKARKEQFSRQMDFDGKAINYPAGLEFIDKLTQGFDLDEEILKEIHTALLSNSRPARYRSRKINNSTNPEEILAEIVKFFDWFNSLEAKETHTILLAGILKFYLDLIKPFEFANQTTSSLMVDAFLLLRGFNTKSLLCLDEYYIKNKGKFESLIDRSNLTQWLWFFTDGVSYEITKMAEKVRVLEKNSKMAKTAGMAVLSDRQLKLVEHLQNFGTLQNKDFPYLFPNISEDSILRDIKTLINKNIIEKTGSTKSSRYELRG